MTKKPRPKKLKGETIEIPTGCGPLYVTLNEDNDGLFEVFSTMGKAGGCASAQIETIGRLISLGLRCGIPPQDMVKQMVGVHCHSAVGNGEEQATSCADAIAKAIKQYMSQNDKPKVSVKDVK